VIAKVPDEMNVWIVFPATKFMAPPVAFAVPVDAIW
jgi:hypothetical protein